MLDREPRCEKCSECNMGIQGTQERNFFFHASRLSFTTPKTPCLWGDGKAREKKIQVATPHTLQQAPTTAYLAAN